MERPNYPQDFFSFEHGVDVNDEKEIQEYKVEELKFKPRHKKIKLSAEEVKACANLEKEN